MRQKLDFDNFRPEVLKTQWSVTIIIPWNHQCMHILQQLRLHQYDCSRLLLWTSMQCSTNIMLWRICAGKYLEPTATIVLDQGIASYQLYPSGRDLYFLATQNRCQKSVAEKSNVFEDFIKIVISFGWISMFIPHVPDNLPGVRNFFITLCFPLLTWQFAALRSVTTPSMQALSTSWFIDSWLPPRIATCKPWHNPMHPGLKLVYNVHCWMLLLHNYHSQ